MIRGSTLSTHLKEHKRKIEAEKTALSRGIVENETRLESLRHDEAKALARFAGVQLEDGGNLPANVRSLIEDRNHALEKATNALDIAEDEIRRLETQRTSLVADLESAEAAHAAKLAEIDGLIATDPRIAALQAEYEEIGRNLDAMADRHRRAQEDALEKGKDYEQDEFFAYLRDRGYGTDGYTGSGLFRTLDRWLSDLIGYREAAADYERLKSIPDWIASRLRELEDKHAERHGLIEQERARHSPSLAPFQDAVRRAKQSLSHHDATLQAARLNGSTASKFVDAVAKGEDPMQRKIESAMVEKIATEKREALRLLAGRTKSGEDDAALGEIEEIGRKRLRLATDADRMRSDLVAVERRLAAVGDIESRLKRKGWDKRAAEFDISDREHDDLILRLASGHMTADTFWVQLHASHREPEPEFDHGTSGGRYQGTSGSGHTGGFGGGYVGGGTTDWSSRTETRREEAGTPSWGTGGGFGGRNDDDTGRKSGGNDSWTTGGGIGGGSDNTSTGGGFGGDD